ncbi:ABC transporter ATP-binding protein [Leucobacter sp. CSA2]|uniref:ABC transporter ATP-binding protein n=1 Tax=Leucobacter edaphi TaxID=2796472 RepID=A0A934QEP8_9MICO|nr:ABC transporter ATP-binding protein [Leucobacter edaphi]MBK0421962.1 ABC transporter ATP-binding protein [Leucobacter edaphi]
MQNPSEPAPQAPVTPSRRDRLRPLELVGFAAVLGIFAGGIVLLATRSFMLALIFLGVAFIATVMTVALIGLGTKPSAEDLEARKDLQLPDDGGKHWH